MPTMILEHPPHTHAHTLPSPHTQTHQRNHSYTYDHVLNDTSSQPEVYAVAAKPLVNGEWSQPYIAIASCIYIIPLWLIVQVTALSWYVCQEEQ